MPDKSQNITVNWKFNTSELTPAEALLRRANEASNNLQASAAKAGSAINQEFQKSRKTILDMQTALTRLKSVIEVTSDPTKLRQLSGEYKNIKTQLDAATKAAYGFDKALKSQGAGVDSLTKQFGNLYGAVQAVVGAAIVKQIANVTLEMARLSGNAQGVQRAFERAFPNSFDILSRLQTATRGTVSEFELMQRTLQATNLGVAVEELPVLFEFAAARAQQTGESVDYLVDSIVRGIGRKSPLILDNLGLSATRLKEKFDGAALASQSVADVTRGVSEIAREELEKMGGYVETGATKVAQLEASWENLRVAFAKRIDSSGIINFFKEAFEGATEALKTQKEIQKEITQQRASIEFASLKENQLNKDKVKDQATLVNRIQDEIRSRMQLIEAGKVEALVLKQKFDIASHTRNGTAKEINDNIKIREQIVQQGLNVQRNVAFYEETVKLLRAYFNELTKVDNKQIETIHSLREELKELQRQREEETFTGNTAELDRLQREILLMENRILKIADNIEWQKKWDRSREESALASINEAKQLEKVNDIIDKMTEKFAGGDIAFSTGNLLPVFDDEKLDTDALNEALEELATTVENSVEKNVARPFKDREFLIRLRLAFQGKGGDTSEIQEMLNEELKKLGLGVGEILTDQAHSIVDAELASYQQRLKNLEGFYDEQMSLAGNNERAKEVLRIREKRETDKLRNEIARKEKQARRTHVLIDMAAGIAKAFATYPWPYALIPAAFVAAQGASQLAIINRAPENFAEGVINLKGPGTEKSDSIPANLSRGESVMTAWETRVAGDVLRDIRAKKLDNRKLREMKDGRVAVKSERFDDQRIIKAIKEQKHPDIVKASNIVYESRTYNDGYKKRVRSRSMGI